MSLALSDAEGTQIKENECPNPKECPNSSDSGRKQLVDINSSNSDGTGMMSNVGRMRGCYLIGKLLSTMQKKRLDIEQYEISVDV